MDNYEDEPTTRKAYWQQVVTKSWEHLWSTAHGNNQKQMKKSWLLIKLIDENLRSVEAQLEQLESSKMGIYIFPSIKTFLLELKEELKF